MKLLFRVLVVCIAVVTRRGHAAEPAKIELYVRQTTTPADQQFLTGVREGEPTTTAGELRRPAAAAARVPAVVLVHGSGGPIARDDRWSRERNDIGIATCLLAKHPRIDATRIGILGGSRGGVVALYASLKRFQRMHAPPDRHRGEARAGPSPESFRSPFDVSDLLLIAEMESVRQPV